MFFIFTDTGYHCPDLDHIRQKLLGICQQAFTQTPENILVFEVLNLKLNGFNDNIVMERLNYHKNGNELMFSMRIGLALKYFQRIDFVNIQTYRDLATAISFILFI